MALLLCRPLIIDTPLHGSCHQVFAYESTILGRVYFKPVFGVNDRWVACITSHLEQLGERTPFGASCSGESWRPLFHSSLGRIPQMQACLAQTSQFQLSFATTDFRLMKLQTPFINRFILKLSIEDDTFTNSPSRSTEYTQEICTLVRRRIFNSHRGKLALSSCIVILHLTIILNFPDVSSSFQMTPKTISLRKYKSTISSICYNTLLA